MIKPKKSVLNTKPYDTPLFEEEYCLKIDANENLFGASEKVLNAIKNITKEDLLKYPVYGNLTQKIADYKGVSIDEVKVTNGADEALFSLINSYLDNGDEMLTVTPSFSMPKLYANLAGGKVVEIPYKERWIFPIEDFLKEIEQNPKIKIIHLTSPNNPTGDCISYDNAEKIINAAKDKLVIFDETYAGYCDFSMIDRVKKYDNIAVVKSFSKDFALAGLRLGYVISNSEVIKTLKTVISPYSVNTIAKIAGVAALSDPEHFEKVKKNVKKSVDFLSSKLMEIGITTYPSKANFVLADAGEKADFIYNLLLNNGIKVRKFSAKETKSLLRITAPDLKNCKKIVSLLTSKPTLIFDMDGVLVDVSNSYRTAIKKTYEYFSGGKTVSDKEIEQAKNLGGLNNDWDLTEYLLKKDGFSADKQDLIDVFQKIYFDDGKGLIKNEKFLFDKKLIEELAKDYHLTVFTGRPKQEALFALKNAQVEDFFYPVITMDDLPVDKQKPDTLGIEKIISKVNTDKIYYFGDTKDDMICGTNAKATAVGVLPPQNQSDEKKNALVSNGAKAVITTINDIKKVI